MYTLCLYISAVSGVRKGIRSLSEWNVWLSIVIVIVLFALGPSVFLLKEFFINVGRYAIHVLQMSFTIHDVQWQSAWTVFYWAWWVAWSPFVGIFIARISKGRTIREFVFGVLFVSTIMSFYLDNGVWRYGSFSGEESRWHSPSGENRFNLFRLRGICQDEPKCCIDKVFIFFDNSVNHYIFCHFCRFGYFHTVYAFL